jgi:hypothetical protein
VTSSFRPSLDQQAALLAAALRQLFQQQQQQQGCTVHTAAGADTAAGAADAEGGGAGGEVWAQLCVVLLRWFASSAVMHPNAKKVGWMAWVYVPFVSKCSSCARAAAVLDGLCTLIAAWLRCAPCMLLLTTLRLLLLLLIAGVWGYVG